MDAEAIRKMQRIMRTELESYGRKKYNHHSNASRMGAKKWIVLALEEERLLIFC